MKYIKVNNKEIKTNKIFYDTTGARSEISNSLKNVNLLFHRKDGNPIDLSDIKNELNVELYTKEYKIDKKYLTKMFDGSITQINDILRSEIDIYETIIIPEYFFYPNNKIKIGKVEFFWSFDIKNPKNESAVYPSLKIIFTKDKEIQDEIYVRKYLDFKKNEDKETPLFNSKVKMYRYLDKKVQEIKVTLLPSGNSKITSYAIFGNNYLGRQLKNLGDLSMAYEASMKGLNLYTQDLIIASYYILFNFYKFILLEKIECNNETIQTKKSDFIFNLDIKKCEYGNLMLYNKIKVKSS